MNAPQVMNVIVASGNNILLLDAIEFDNKLWLVPEWYVNQERKLTSPARIIRFDNLRHQKLDDVLYHFQLTDPIPESVLDGKATDGYEVHESPDIVGPYRESN